MPVIGLDHVRYETEKDRYINIVELFDGLKKVLDDLRRKQEHDKQNIFQLMSESISVTRSRHVSDMVGRIKSRLSVEFDLELFVARHELANVGCMHFDRENATCPTAVIIASQHFFEDLEEQEQLFVLGHEVGHLLYGHTQIPTQVVLNLPPQPDPDRTEALFRLKKQVLGWHTAAEISADLVGMIATGPSSGPVLSALTKISTGLSGRSLEKLFVYEDGNTLHEFLNQQFDHVSDSDQSSDLTTHPLIPARAKIAGDICDHFLLHNYGKEVPDPQVHVRDLTGKIDNIILKVYEDVVPPERRAELLKNAAPGEITRPQLIKGISEPLGTAVMLADGFLHQEEFDALSGLISSSKKNILDRLKQQLPVYNISGKDTGSGKLKLSPIESVMKLVQNYVEQAVEVAKKGRMDKQMFMEIMRNMLALSVADGEVEESELAVIKSFSDSFSVGNDTFYMLVNKLLKEFKY